VHAPRLFYLRLGPLSVGLLLLCGSALGAGRDAGLTRELHPWGRFREGAWKQSRLVTHTFDERGELVSTSVTETRTTLKKVEADGVVLLVEAVVEVGGQELATPPKTVKLGFHGENAAESAVVRTLQPGQVTVGGRIIPCSVQQVETNDAGNGTITKVYYSPTVAPFILRKESVTTDAQGHVKLSETTLEVVSLRMPCKVLNIRSTAHVKVVSKHPKGASTTWAFTSVDVPGGVVCRTIRELDENGRLLRRSTLELVGYGLDPEDETPTLLSRWRNRHRAARTPPR